MVFYLLINIILFILISTLIKRRCVYQKFFIERFICDFTLKLTVWLTINFIIWSLILISVYLIRILFSISLSWTYWIFQIIWSKMLLNKIKVQTILWVLGVMMHIMRFITHRIKIQFIKFKFFQIHFNNLRLQFEMEIICVFLTQCFELFFQNKILLFIFCLPFEIKI